MIKEKSTFVLIIANRRTFPQQLTAEAEEKLHRILSDAGIELFSGRGFVVSSTLDGRELNAELRRHREDFSGVIVSFPNFGDESGVLEAVRNLNLPILLHAFPDEFARMGAGSRRDAFCGKIAAASLLFQAQVKFTPMVPHTCEPDSPEFSAALESFITVCRIVKGLGHLRVGTIGARCTPFKSVRFDEAAFEKYGISSEAFDLSMLFALVRSVSPESSEFLKTREELLAISEWSCVPEENIQTLVKIACALDRIISENHLDAISLRCWDEFEKEFNVAPCVILALLNHRGITANCEADTVNAIAMHALRLALQQPVTCLDWNNNWSADANSCVLFHCGPVADELLETPGKMVEHLLLNGVHGSSQGWLRAGNVTCCGGMTRNGELRFYTASGRVTDDRLPENFFGAGGVVRFDDLESLIKLVTGNGFSHHVALGFGDCTEVLREALGKYLGCRMIDQ